MKKIALAAAGALLLSAAPVFACPDDGGGESMRKTAEKTKAKPDVAKETAPKGATDTAGSTPQKEAPKSAEKKSS